MTDKVYAVAYSDWDWHEIISMHKTKEGAEAALTYCKANHENHYHSDYFELEEYELNE